MVKLHARANEALNRVNDTSYKTHINKLWSEKEYAFALLVLWCQIETRLKLIRYFDKVKDGWPDKLTFIRKDWAPLKRLVNERENDYLSIFVGQRSMWKLRDLIAHAAISIDMQEATLLRKSGEWVLSKLDSIKPERAALLEKKRRSDAQINRSKTKTAI